MMRVWKKAPVMIILLLICLVFAGTALADRGYTTTDKIPMAVHFSVAVEFDNDGLPHVVTDYPFDKTGATEMDLVYNKGSEYEAAVLKYTPATDATVIEGYNSSIYPDGSSAAIRRDIQNGELTLDDNVYVSAMNRSAGTCWSLAYSTTQKRYVEYTEKTCAQAFNAMGPGGTAKTIYYQSGTIESSRILKRLENADLLMEYDPTGNLEYASVQTWGILTASYDYNPSTGLFGKYTLSELGFDDEDLSIPAPAAVSAEEVEPSETLRQTTGKSPAVTIAGGLVTGILIGVILYYMNRRKKAAEEKTEEKATE